MIKILIIDDSSYMRGKIRSLLKETGYEISEAGSGVQAFQSIASADFDIILLDIIMPEMDGLKVLSAFTKQKPDTPVIVITADIQESVRKQFLQLGARAVLHKPPRREDLINSIREHLSPDEGGPQCN